VQLREHEFKFIRGSDSVQTSASLSTWLRLRLRLGLTLGGARPD